MNSAGRDDRHTLVKPEAVDAIFSAMRADASPTTQEHGCKALADLAQPYQNAAIMGDLGSMNPVFDVIINYAGNASVLAAAFLALAALAQTDVNNERLQLLRAEVSTVILTLPDGTAIVATPLTSGGGAHGLGPDGQVGADDGPTVFERVLGSMKRHGTISILVQAACRFLAVAARNEENKRYIVYSKGADSILRASDPYPLSESVQAAAMEALCNLGDRGIEEVLGRMRRQSTNAVVQTAACRALKAAIDTPGVDKRVDIVNLGGIEVVLAAMNRHPAHSALQEHACWALSALAVSPWNKAAMLEQKAIETVVAGMRCNEHSLTVIEVAYIALHSLARAPAHASVPIIVAELQSVVNLRCAIACSTLCGIIASLATALESGVALTRSGAIEAVLAAMRAHPSHADVQLEGCKAITHLLKTGAKAKKEVRQRRGVAVARAALDAHVGHASVKYWSRAVIESTKPSSCLIA